MSMSSHGRLKESSEGITCVVGHVRTAETVLGGMIKDMGSASTYAPSLTRIFLNVTSMVIALHGFRYAIECNGYWSKRCYNEFLEVKESFSLQGLYGRG